MGLSGNLTRRNTKVRSTADEFVVAGDTLVQLQDFFQQHTFDTAGAFSDLFSVLLSCCKHLVDSSLQHHAAIAAQKSEIARLRSEAEMWRGMAMRLETVDNRTEIPPGGDQSYRHRDYEELRIRSTTCDAFHARDSAEQQNKCGCCVRASSVESNKKNRIVAADGNGPEAVRAASSAGGAKLREAVEPMGTPSGREEVTRISDTIASLTSSIALDQPSALRRYVDSKAAAIKEELKEEFSIALQESSMSESFMNVNSPPPCQSVGNSEPMAFLRGCTAVCRNEGVGHGETWPETLSNCIRRLVADVTHCVNEKLEKIEGRLEALEVYAPHHCAMVARPPYLGVELCDVNGEVHVQKVFHGLAAQVAGVMPGDVITAVNGVAVHTRAEVYAVFTDLARQHEAQRNLIIRKFFEAHLQSARKCSAHAQLGGWEVPLLELTLYVKRGCVLHEIVIPCGSVRKSA
ncbi:PDZ domain [Trypanosoma vivax]|uniref:PDZ domain-containing protein n=1 Tax=Trypanosoma vivax (strain Y486) TaxID=1055687 RepID=G0U4X8_TRYVY|nr:hypothetical protein TRVL_03121 [Trypanosoma vivax]KAH8611565.1 PDZ domain [Trypanosoma vivax]CCC52493.1 conserved hypothetical protein [Trypanosoma vivax Y486]